MEKIVYFSLVKDNRNKFTEFCSKNQYISKYSFKPVYLKNYRDPRDLLQFIEKTEDKDALHVIIDYKSMKDSADGSIQRDSDAYAEVVRDIIMAYPEVQFLFDVSNEDQSEGILKFLFPNKSIDNGILKYKYYDGSIPEGSEKDVQVFIDFHTFKMEDFKKGDLSPNILLVKGRNNVFDASNLRRAIKLVKLEKLKVKDNYLKLNSSRQENAAVVVDEEYHQTMFNSYCLYANGYRVLPVTTAHELLSINEREKRDNGETSDMLVIRDYDLQFVDEDKANIDEDQKDNDGVKWCKTDIIRGAKLIDEKKVKFIMYESSLFKDSTPNKCWSSFSTDKTFFISKGGEHLYVELDCSQDKQKYMDVKSGKIKDGLKSGLRLRGLKKPIEGIYYSYQRICKIKETYGNTRYSPLDKDYIMVTRRIGIDGHACPLDIYGIVRSMVRRSERYYGEKQYRLAALVAGESLAILNGFHMSLMKRAYYILAVSENAMAMSLLGGEEPKLIDDINFRFKKIKEEVTRMIPDKVDRTNVLNNIFNDCRVFCREVEYLDAADEALSFIAHEIEGINIGEMIKNVGVGIYLIIKRFVCYIRKITTKGNRRIKR